MKKWIYLLLLICGIFIGGLIVKQYYQPAVAQKSATVLLESVRKVLKLVTVEGEFSEIYNETNIKPITLYLPIPTTFRFSKTANIHVTGKALVGYNMEKMGFKLEEDSKTLIVSNLPSPEILAIEHNLSYQSLEESFFNGFSPEDYTQLNKNAKDAIKANILKGALLKKAEEQGNEVVQVIQTIVESAGWTFKLENANDGFNVKVLD